MPFVLIDLRDKKTAEKEHLPNAVNIPLEDLEKWKDKFPTHKKAPIILYAEDDEKAIKGFTLVRSWGYINAAYLPGGVSSWKQAGGQVLSKAFKKEIVYVPKPKPGSFPVEEFKKIALSQEMSDKYFILDVREADEYAQGAFKFAKNIPLSQLEDRLNEIPKEKEILVHCATGVRAEMAYNTLKKAGFKVYFIDAKIEFQNGKVNIIPNE
ncbi:MAG: rhodanese-like domain-containing protein [Caldimicrobium sp.]